MDQELWRKVWAGKAVSGHQDISGVKPCRERAGPATQQEQAEEEDPAKETPVQEVEGVLDRCEYQGD